MYIPKEVSHIIGELENNGFEAFAVGGCVRDKILGKEPKDWDITTSAKPEDIKRIFKRTIDTGIEHGTVTVLIDKVGYEITTYRLDGKYSDGRHPDKVEFSSSLFEDLKRRDFTINAMAYSPKAGLVDIFGGVRDLKKKEIKCVGKATDRFGEDALRMLRAIRFSAQLNFSIEKDTLKAIYEIRENLSKVSKERIFVELNKTLQSDNPERISLIFETGIKDFICESMHYLTSDDYESFHIARNLSDKKYLRWSALLRNHSRDFNAKILKELKSDNDTINRVKDISKYIKTSLPQDKFEIKKMMFDVGSECVLDIIELKETGFCDTKDDYKKIRGLVEEIIFKKEAYTIKMLDIDGKDLINSGFEQGAVLGEVLLKLLYEVMEDKLVNRKDILLVRAEEMQKTAYRN